MMPSQTKAEKVQSHKTVLERFKKKPKNPTTRDLRGKERKPKANIPTELLIFTKNTESFN